MKNILEILSESFLLFERNFDMKMNNLRISAYSDEGHREPHFHIHTRFHNGSKGGCEFECCVSFLECKYENHGTIQGVLNRTQKEKLNKVLRENNQKIWKELIKEWNRNPISMHRIKGIPPIPDYTKL